MIFFLHFFIFPFTFFYVKLSDTVIVSDVWGGSIYSVNRETGVTVPIVQGVSRAISVAVGK